MGLHWALPRGLVEHPPRLCLVFLLGHYYALPWNLIGLALGLLLGWSLELYCAVLWILIGHPRGASLGCPLASHWALPWASYIFDPPHYPLEERRYPGGEMFSGAQCSTMYLASGQLLSQGLVHDFRCLGLCSTLLCILCECGRPRWIL